MGTLGLTDRARVLHAALSFAEFTVEQLAAFSGVKAPTVQTTLGRSGELIEKLGKAEADGPGGRALVYRLKKDARQKLAAEVLALTQGLRDGPVPEASHGSRSANAALDALESSLAFARHPGDSGQSAEYWRERALRQSQLSGRLIGLLPKGSHRTELEARLRTLRVEAGTPAERSVEGVESKQEWREAWRSFVEGLMPARRHGPALDYFAPLKVSPGVTLAPAAVFGAVADGALAGSITKQLVAAHRPVACFELHDALVQLGKPDVQHAMYRALDATPRGTTFLVVLDSANETSRRSVLELLRYMKDYLWLKVDSDHPRVVPEVALFDKTSNEQFVRAQVMFNNLEYMTYVRVGTAPQLVAAMVNSKPEDATRFFAADGA